MRSKPKGMGLGIALGTALGAVAGVMAGHVAIWLAVGMAIGVAIGSTVRRQKNECPKCAALHVSHEDRAHEVNMKQLQS
jgi:RsiW-degrading membrane proteinase PrsW (M82 family)